MRVGEARAARSARRGRPPPGAASAVSCDADAAGDPVAGDRERPRDRQRRVERADDAVLEDHGAELSEAWSNSPRHGPRLRRRGRASAGHARPVDRDGDPQRRRRGRTPHALAVARRDSRRDPSLGRARRARRPRVRPRSRDRVDALRGRRRDRAVDRRPRRPARRRRAQPSRARAVVPERTRRRPRRRRVDVRGPRRAPSGRSRPARRTSRPRRAFYERLLAPARRASVMMDVGSEWLAAGSARLGKPQFWITDARGSSAPAHVAFAAPDRATVDAFHDAAIAAGGRTTAPPGLRDALPRRRTTAPSCSTPTATTSRRSATGLSRPSTRAWDPLTDEQREIRDLVRHARARADRAARGRDRRVARVPVGRRRALPRERASSGSSSTRSTAASAPARCSRSSRSRRSRRSARRAG